MKVRCFTPCAELPLPSLVTFKNCESKLTCSSVRENRRRLGVVGLLDHEGQIGTMEGRWCDCYTSGCEVFADISGQ